MTRFLALAALVAACSSPAQSQPPARDARVRAADAAGHADAAVDAHALVDAGTLVDAAPAKKLGKHGAVCRLGVRSLQAHEGRTVLECGAGLHCCYPCGIQGCDFTCMTQAECNVRRP